MAGDWFDLKFFHFVILPVVKVHIVLPEEWLLSLTAGTFLVGLSRLKQCKIACGQKLLPHLV